MPEEKKKFRFFLMQPFTLPAGTKWSPRRLTGTKEHLLMNYENVKHLLADVEWDLHEGPWPLMGIGRLRTGKSFAWWPQAVCPSSGRPVRAVSTMPSFSWEAESRVL